MIRLCGIEKTYRNKDVSFRALNGISLEIPTGEFTAVMGRSGCGKTTLMNIMGFMDRYDAGQYFFDGRDVSGFSNAELCRLRNKSIGFVFQSFNLVSDYSLLENVEMPMGYAGIPAKQRRGRAAAALESVGLSDKLKNRPSQLSGGQQQRAAIARAIVNEPSVILADEPTGNLDARSGDEVMALLESLRNKGMTIVLVTHDEKVAACAQRRIFMSDGLITADMK
jgi:putative ABC transport system ATP-binding protein